MRKHRYDTLGRRIAFGKRLRIVQVALGMSENQMADAIGVTVKTLKAWQRGKRQKGFGATASFANDYDISIDWLVMGNTRNLSDRLARNPGGKIAILRTRNETRLHPDYQPAA